MIIQNNYSKITKSINAYLDNNTNNTDIKLLEIGSDVYKIHFKNKEEKRYMFHVSSLTQAIVSFIEEYHADHEIYLYHDMTLDHNIIGMCKNIILENTNVTAPNASIIPNVVNNISFFAIDTKIKFNNSSFLNASIKNVNILNTIGDTYDVVMFDGSYPSKYNLGYTTESEKNTILNSSLGYLNLTNEYIAEASLLKKKTWQIDNYGNRIEVDIGDNYITIQDFITNILKA
jgi:hypothetical protein